MDRERRKLKEEGEEAAKAFRAQLSEAKEETESLRGALLQSNADTRRWAGASSAGSNSDADADG